MLSVTKRVQIGTESSLGKGGMDGRRHREVEGGGKNNLGLTEEEGGGPFESDDLADCLFFSGRFCREERVRDLDKKAGK